MTAATTNPASNRVTDSALREFGLRITQLDNTQSLMLARLDALGVQMAGICTDNKAMGVLLDDHGRRLLLAETRWEDQIKPAIKQLDEVRMQVARSALFGAAGGGSVAAIVVVVLKAVGLV